jgi:hypothetical protein
MDEPRSIRRSVERRVLAKLVRLYVGTSRGVFEFADGRHVEVEGAMEFAAIEAPQLGEKAFVVVDGSGRALRWEPYPAGRIRRSST